MSEQSNNPLSADRVETLLFAVKHGTLNAAERDELSAWVTASRANAEHYFEYMVDERGLAIALGGQQVEQLDRIDDDGSGLLDVLAQIEAQAHEVGPVDITEQLAERERLQHQRQGKPRQELADARPRVFVIPRAVVWGGLAAAVLAVAWAGITLFSPASPAPDQTAGLEDSPQQPDDSEKLPRPPIRVGQVVAALNGRWSDGAAVVTGATVVDQEIELTEGIVQLRLDNGVLVTLESPCTFKADSPDRVHLTRGKLVGNVPPNAVGFTVHTPGMDVIDLSTEFAIRVDAVEDENGEAGSTEVSVLDGKVQVRPGGASAQGGDSEVVLAGQSRRAEPGTKSLLAGRAEPSAFYRWVPSAYEKTVRDLGPVAYWRFEDGDGLSLSDNLARSGDRVTQVGRVGAEPRGAVGGSASFDGQSRLVLEGPRGLDLMHSFTIASWVFLEPGVEGLRRVFSNALFLGDQATAGFGLGVNHMADGQPQAFFTFYGIADYRGDTPLPTGRWVHLAVSIDREGRPTFYIDGVADTYRLFSNPSQLTPPPPGRLSDADAWIGDAPVAGSAASEAFQGRIDELVVFPSVLDREQIERLAHRLVEQP